MQLYHLEASSMQLVNYWPPGVPIIDLLFNFMPHFLLDLTDPLSISTGYKGSYAKYINQVSLVLLSISIDTL